MFRWIKQRFCKHAWKVYHTEILRYEQTVYHDSYHLEQGKQCKEYVIVALFKQCIKCDKFEIEEQKQFNKEWHEK